ncbi:tRNA epoxyqueuosine(34) reductase QueG [Motiliproteus coralliicola]|uniref:Epoxyqueuosine reductase n=1 Tax=Motiliproteus coralliicola TaxID=2283196 RepID=A0A369WGA1_9GAMM|nr:tRNA epoxyqueuosine(34) reductase QueG [Motiliproteus coralliicola]RDE19636.1 tRNA epoxyqueuosine(34) reductase QueG [Motiliproteus coralliicola]
MPSKPEPQAPTQPSISASPEQLTAQVKDWAKELGFSAVGITGIDTADAVQRLEAWLNKGFHGSMGYLANHRELRRHPEQLHPGTLKVISVRMDYLPPEVETVRVLQNPNQAYISRYALGRDYHKTLRKRLVRLAKQIEQHCGSFNYRPFVDSAPVMEKPMAQRAGLGWQGKHSLLIDRKAGSYFVLGELFTDLPLVDDAPYTEDHCSRCSACIDVCPTDAIPEPYVLDARRCISYLTIESKEPIPLELRPLIGNRVFGCDDCQLVCPWNRYCHFTGESDFNPRHQLDTIELAELFQWDEATFLKKTEGSPIRRSGYQGWLRNLAVGLGNSGDKAMIEVLKQQQDNPSELVREHVAWAIEQLSSEQGPSPLPLTDRQPRKVRHLL